MYIFTLFVEKHFIWVFTICQCTCLLLLTDFFSRLLFQKIISGIPSQCQTAWIQIRSEFIQACMSKIQVLFKDF